MSARTYSRLTLVVMSLLALVLMVMMSVEANAMNVVEGAPEGFEQLDAPRATQINLYYGGEPLGSFAAHTTPTTVTIDQPAKLIAAIPTIKNKEAVAAALSAPMPTNADKLCTIKKVDDCGELKPAIIGIIYDETRLAGELFFNANMLSVVNSTSTRYLPLPERKFSSVYGFTGAVNGVDAAAPNYAVTKTGTFSVGEARLNTQTTMSTDGLRFDTAAASVERRGMNATTGLFGSRGMQLMADRDIAGVSVSTSRKTVLDAKKSEGNAIIVFLPRQSFVSIYREGRLYSSRGYAAGNQQIDTAELPEGAYDITLKIQEADGTTREEKRFYVKSYDLPPKGEPSYYAQAGMIRKPAGDDSALPEVTSNPLVTAGTVYRVTDSTAVSAAVLGIGDRAVTELGALWMDDGVQARATTLGSTKGDFGVGGNVSFYKKRFSASVDARQLWLADTPLSGYEDITNGFTQISATSSYAVSDGVSVGLRGSYSRQQDSGTTSSIGPYAEWQVWQDGESMVGISADAARIDGRNQGSIFMNFTYRFGANNGVSGSLGNAMGQQNNGPVGAGRVWHENNEPGNNWRVAGGLSGDKVNQTVSGDGDWRNHLGQFHGGVQKTFGQTNNTTYGGSFAVGVAQAGDEVRIGGDQADSSAVIVDVDGDAKGTMRIFVNGMEQSAVDIGGKRVLYLNPFHTYNIRIAPEKAGLLDYESGDRKVTLYPGNVAKLKWSVNHFYVVSAKIVDTNGQPIAGALLEEARDELVTSDEGRIQAELPNPKTLTFMRKENGECRVTLPAAQPQNGVLLYTQPLTCEGVN